MAEQDDARQTVPTAYEAETSSPNMFLPLLTEMKKINSSIKTIQQNVNNLVVVEDSNMPEVTLDDIHD